MAQTAKSPNEALKPEPLKTSPKFSVWYLGSLHMDRLYSQTMQPLVMAEIRRKKEEIQEVVIEVVGEVLKIHKSDPNQEVQETLFEHHLKGLTRFAKLHQDPRCFAYLTRYHPTADFECHVFLANAGEIIPQLFRAIRDASKDLHNKPLPQGDGQQPGGAVGDQSQQSPTDSSSSGQSQDEDDQSKCLFEVKYMGRAKVGAKRVTADYIDSLAEKMIARDEDMSMKRLGEMEEEKKREKEEVEVRRRHASDASVQSLPDTFDCVEEKLTTENKLEEQKEMMQQRNQESPICKDKSVSSSNIAKPINSDISSSESLPFVDTVTSLSDSLARGGQDDKPTPLQVDFHSDSDSSRDNLSASDEQSLNSRKLSQSQRPLRISPLAGDPYRKRHSSHKEEGTSAAARISFQGQNQERQRRASGDSVDSVGSIHTLHELSRIMVLQISSHDIALISLDKKKAIMECNFTDISFVSQGSHKQDMFGIVARESGSTFICYILKCLSDSVVAEIMSTLQTAFTAAYSKRGASTVQHNTGGGGGSGVVVPSSSGTTSQHQVCTMCPLHQLHRLCQEVNALSPQAAHDLLVKKVHQLPDREVNEINQRMQVDAPESFEESVEVIMICLRQLCEKKQKVHSHISEGNKTNKVDINFLEEKQKLFEGLRNKAKKSLTTSFENLLSRGRKKEDIRDGFRQRSWTTDSEASWASRDSSATSTPDASPMPSPMSKDFHHDFPSPPSSPGPLRQRSSTLDSPGSSPSEMARRRDVNHNRTTSPMKTMFLLATNSSQQSESVPSSSVSSPMDDHNLLAPPRRQSESWRKAIFNRVCTPQHSFEFDEEGANSEGSIGKLHNASEIRAMWKKAILETLLLIRMEKENHHIRAREEEGGGTVSRKLEYQELTPCLKDITSVWEKMLMLPEGYEEAEVDGRLAQEEGAVPQIRLMEYVKKGVPRTLRGQIWLFLMQQRQMSSTVPSDKACETSKYEDLLKQLTTHQHAILIDLGRTFPSHPYFAKALGPGQLELFNLLKAYSLLDPEVGYCQGLSFIVGMLLMHMEEISAFHVLKYMMYDLGLRKQFRPNMTALQIKLYQLTRLLHDHFKDVYDHFETHEISPTLYAAPWFLTLFASQFPLGFVARVFDMIFVQGIDALFKVALMLLGNHRALILQCDSFETIVDFLKTTLPEMVQVQMERIIDQAFDMDINKELQAYEVEYHVLSEEMTYSPAPPHHHHHHHHHHQHNKTHSPSAGTAAERPTRLVERRRSSIDIEMMYRMEQQNRGLKQQNLDLLEKLQHAQSQHRSSEHSIHSYQIELDKVKSHIRTLELERAALLTAVAKLRKLVPRDALQRLNLSLPALPPSSPTTAPLKPNFSVPSATSKPAGSPVEGVEQKESDLPLSEAAVEKPKTNSEADISSILSRSLPKLKVKTLSLDESLDKGLSTITDTSSCESGLRHSVTTVGGPGSDTINSASRELNFQPTESTGTSSATSKPSVVVKVQSNNISNFTMSGEPLNLPPDSTTKKPLTACSSSPLSSPVMDSGRKEGVKRQLSSGKLSSRASNFVSNPSLSSSFSDTNIGARVRYPPRTISNAVGFVPPGILEERKRSVKVTVQHSPTMKRPDGSSSSR